MGATRSRRHASTASSNSPLYPARPSNSATRSRFFSGCEASGCPAVAAYTQRAYGTASPLPATSMANSHITSSESAMLIR